MGVQKVDSVTLTNLSKAPFPYFGGKRKAAPDVWGLLGDVPHYVEPFAGSLAVLLERPHPANRPYVSETVNDADGLIVNVWRSIQQFPEVTAEHASWPVSEADKTARQIAVLRWRDEVMLDRLAGDPVWCDPQMAGWWVWGLCCQIGAVGGPWTVDRVTGRIVKQGRGVRRGRPHLTGNGQGVNHPGIREPGVTRDRPHLSSDGQGVNHAGTREPGVSRGRPHLSNNGMGVNHPGTREPGVSRLDQTDNPDGFHPVTMPELVRWFQWLSARLRHVRILNGDWSRLVTTGAAHTLMVRQGKGPAGVFLDPPYASSERASGLYGHGHDSGDVAGVAREWAQGVGDDPKWRIVLAGYDTEHAALESAGWSVHEWFTDGHLAGGMGNVGGEHQQKRERLWASPHCVTGGGQLGMFDQ